MSFQPEEFRAFFTRKSVLLKHGSQRSKGELKIKTSLKNKEQQQQQQQQNYNGRSIIWSAYFDQI